MPLALISVFNNLEHFVHERNIVFCRICGDAKQEATKLYLNYWCNFCNA